MPDDPWKTPVFQLMSKVPKTMATVIAGLVIAAFGIRVSAEETKPVGPVEVLTTDEFLKLDQHLQAVFVGGIIEGLSFFAYGYSIPDYPAWAACARSKNLGDTTADVVAFVRETTNFDEGIASAVAQVIGKRCKHSSPNTPLHRPQVR
jgi:hypothetical protein